LFLQVLTPAAAEQHYFDDIGFGESGGVESLKVTLPTGAGGQSVTNAHGPAHGPLPWGLAIGRTYTLSLHVWVPSGVSAVQVAVPGPSAPSPPSTKNGQWERLSVAFTCNDATGNYPVVYPTGATTAGQAIYVDAVQLELGGSLSVYSTAGPTVYVLFL